MKCLMIALCIFSVAGSQASYYEFSNTSTSKDQKVILNLYYSNSCPYSIKVLRYLKSIHKSLPMTEVHADPQARQYLKTYGGKAQVPCLFINDQAMYESDDIIQWLSEHQDLLDPE